MARVLTLSVVDDGFEPWSVQTKDYKWNWYLLHASQLITQHKVIRAKTDWLGITDNMSEWDDMSIRQLLFQLTSFKNPTKHFGLVQSGPRHQLIRM